MKASSISLAVGAVLTVASLNSAMAGVAIISAWPNRVPPMRMVAPPMNPAAGRFGPIGQNGLRHGWSPAAPFFAPIYVGSPGPHPSEGGEPLAGPIIWAPTEVTLAAPAPRCAYGFPPAAAIGGGPKIIMIGAPSRSARLRKMPIVIYGTGGGQAY